MSSNPFLWIISVQKLNIQDKEEEEEEVSTGSDFSSEDYEFDYVSATS